MKGSVCGLCVYVSTCILLALYIKYHHSFLGESNFVINGSSFTPGPHTLDITISTLEAQVLSVPSLVFIIEREFFVLLTKPVTS